MDGWGPLHREAPWARAEAAADADCVLVSPTTHRLTQHLFVYACAGAHDLKGFAQPVELWQPVEELAITSRFKATRALAVSPLVGRDDEVALLRRRWRRC